ncbi:MAG: glycosyltransferase [Gammaproteobacteria bacterium]|nr:glycosyltransferase [Gammaproteobacteria bacterium]
MSNSSSSRPSLSRVSVIIPLYNRADYIEQTVRSVLAQTLPVAELIVVDDGSTDDGAAKVAAIAGVTLLRHEGGANKGQAASINLGLRQASGEVIAILDSDDYWHPQFIETLLARLNAPDQPDLVYANGSAVDGDGGYLYPLFGAGHIERNEAWRLLVDCYIASPGLYLARRSLYQRVGEVDESLRAAQDHDMLLRLAEQGRLAYVDQPLFYYRKHGDSISARGQERRWRNGFVILAKARCRYPYPPRALRKRQAVLHYRLGQVLRQQGQGMRGGLHLLAALLLDPQRALAVATGRERKA